jgi:ElaB/YqjD/DUF883 family membrane-anchored ribosome-binding protein
MAAKRRRKSQADAGASGESTEGAEAGEGAERADGGEGADAPESSINEASGDEAAQAAAETPQPVAQTPAVTRPASDTPARSVRELGQHTAASYQQSRDSAEEFVQSARERIREQPVQSLLIAAGVGVLIGIIWR